MIKQLWEIREEVRRKRPLVVNITNTVVTNFTANVLLAAGAAPIMSEGAAEAESLARMADALLLNIGTLHTRQITYIMKAGEFANKFGKPVVFDPVGVGATPYRNMTSLQILNDLKLALIRGNYGEISFLAGMGDQAVRGVDSASSGIETDVLKKLAHQRETVIAATGPVDYVTDGQMVFTNGTGDILLQFVTGTGCALSSLCGAFMAAAQDPRLGVLAALAYYGAAAEKAARTCKGPGSFSIKFLDALYNLSYKEFRKSAADKVGIVGQACPGEEAASEEPDETDGLAGKE